MVAPPGEGFEPVGRRLPAEATLRISLFWRMAHSVDRNYTVFVHAVNQDGDVVAQHDGWPADAHRPTSVLPAGTEFRDVHYLSLPPDPPDDLALRVGIYDEEGGRLLTDEGQGFVSLPLVP